MNNESLMKAFTVVTYPVVMSENYLKERVDDCAEKIVRRSHKSKTAIKIDIIKEFYCRYIQPEEYMRWEFENKSLKERCAYWPDRIAVRKMKSPQNNVLSGNKYDRYLLFKDFVKRDLIFVEHDADWKVVAAFQEKHSPFVAKPYNGSKGRGIMLVDEHNLKEFEHELRSSKEGYVLEERIIQGEELARFHPQSVNTIRFASMMDKEHHRVNAFALLRTGAGESFVDNVGAGGVAALIDTNTGIIISDGICGDKHYQAHPDTGIVFKGSVIPAWDELLKIADAVHGMYPKQKVFGFDFAWTAKGWDIVELNPAPSFATYQAIIGRGIKEMAKEAGFSMEPPK